MGTTLKTYVTVTGVVKEKVYERKPYSKRNKRPTCPLNNCKGKLLKIYGHEKGCTIQVGLRCASCNALLMFDNYDVFKVRVS